MAAFKGFPEGKVRFTPLPAPFFGELLPQIDDLNELKLTLYAFWKLDRLDGDTRYLQLQDFVEDEVFMAGLGSEPEQGLQDGLARTQARGTLLKADLELEGETRAFYFLNTARGRGAVQALADGKWQPSGDPRYPLTLSQERPNLFALYEQHIGALTPMIADALKQAEQDYPHEWLEEAIRISVENNARKWSYVEAILRRWQEGGREQGRPQGNTEKDRRKYFEGEFSDFIER